MSFEDLSRRFDFTTHGAVLLCPMIAHQAMRDFAVLVDNAFNDAGAHITIGTMANQSMIMGITDSLLTVAGEYRIEGARLMDITAPIYAFFAPGHATRGSGCIFYSREK